MPHARARTRAGSGRRSCPCHAVAYVDFGHPWSDLAALSIALVKASLVVAFFMHVKGSTAMIKIAVFSGAFWLAIFFVLILADYLTRIITFSG